MLNKEEDDFSIAKDKYTSKRGRIYKVRNDMSKYLKLNLLDEKIM